MHIIPPLQTTPQPPQLGLPSRVTSQPLEFMPSQLPKPGTQVMPQLLPTHTGTECCGVGQTLPHVPQWVAEVVVSVSQPFALLLSQLPKPVLHAPMVQAEPTQGVAAALARAGQALLQAPQLLALLVVLISQPLVRLLASQSAKPTLQVPVQLPPEQAATMLLLEQVLPVQPPQVATEVLMSVSQPFVWRLASQSARPAEQVPLQTLPLQVRDTTPVPEHTVPQAPHESGSLVRLRHTLEQLVCPDPQLVTHTPAEQSCGETHARGTGTVEHAPQLALSLLRLTSQPLAGLPSQLAKPALQLAMVHAPAAQPAVALASEQTVLQVPQLVALVWVLVSQPSLRLPLQLPRPGEQMMPQSPPVQLAVPPVDTQARPQAPQLVVVVMFTSHMSLGRPLQSAVPGAQLTLDVPQAELAHTAMLPTGGVWQAVPHAPQF
jgi:hypothetical protein